MDASNLPPLKMPVRTAPESMNAPKGRGGAERDRAGEFTVCSGSAVNDEDSASKVNKAAKWSAWYDPCFSRVTASSRIEAVDKSPISASALPPCLLADQNTATDDMLLPPREPDSSLKGETYLLGRQKTLVSASLLRRAFGLYVELLLDPRIVMGEGIVPSALRTGTHDTSSLSSTTSSHTNTSSSPGSSSASAKASNSSAKSRARAVASEIDPLHGALWRRAVSIAHESATIIQGGHQTAIPAVEVDTLATGVASMDAIVDQLVFAPIRLYDVHASPSAELNSTSNSDLSGRSSSTLQQPFLSTASLTTIVRDVFDLSALAILLVLNLTFAAASHFYLRVRSPRRFHSRFEVNDPTARASETTMNAPVNARFTVVIPAFNEAASISRALASVIRGYCQAKDGDGNAYRAARITVDVVVVDGGSTDGTEATVKAFVASHAEAFRMAHEEDRSRALSESVEANSNNEAQRAVAVHLTRCTGGRGPALAHGVALTEKDTSCSRQLSGADPDTRDFLEAVVVLHADSELPDQWTHSAMRLLVNPRVSMVAFPFRLQRNQLPINNDAIGLRNLVRCWSVALLEKSVELRSSRFELPFGDQVHFLKFYLICVS